MYQLYQKSHDWLDQTRAANFLGPLILRLYLAPVFWIAGTNKLADMDSVIAWFGNDDWGLGLPIPAFFAWAAVLTEVLGAILLVVGFAVRWVSIPLMITMLVAMFAVHWPNGWQAVADPMSAFASSDVAESIRRLDIARDILKEHGNYSWLTEKGSLVVSNNGIEWAFTYFAMCLVLFFNGAGGYASVDYYLAKKFKAAD